VGRRGRDHARRRRIESPRAWTGISLPNAENAREIAEYLIERFLSGASDEVVLVYARFVSAMSQVPTLTTVLPVLAAGDASAAPRCRTRSSPIHSHCSPRCCRAWCSSRCCGALLENSASEHGARMSAMESATENTRELIRSLTLDMNKARQTQITTELTEIVAAPRRSRETEMTDGKVLQVLGAWWTSSSRRASCRRSSRRSPFRTRDRYAQRQPRRRSRAAPR